MSHAAFLSAIREAPEDDTARLVYADYLDEQGGPGDVARAEFIRVQIRLAGLGDTAPERPALEDRENELLRTHEHEWVGRLHDRLARGLLRWRFERGFLATVQVSAAALANRGTGLFAAHPVDRVRLTDLNSAPEKTLVRARWWSRVRDLDTGRSAPTFARLEALLRAPHLTRLRKLGFDTHAAPGPVGLPELLASCPATARLEELDVRDPRCDPAELLPYLNGSSVRFLKLAQNAISPNGMRKLLTSEFAARDVRVHLEGAGLRPNLWSAFEAKKARPVVERVSFKSRPRADALGLPTLLSSPAAVNLTALDLSETNLSSAAVQGIAATGFLARATELGLTRCRVEPKGVAALARVPAPNLRKLSLGEAGLKNSGVFELCAAPWADALTDLNLMRNAIDDEALVAMAESGRFVNVRHIDFRVNSPDLEGGCRAAIGDRGVSALAAAPNFSRLRYLNLYRTRVTARGVEALLNSPHCRLAGLELGGYDLGAELPEVLARAPALARLTALSLSFTPSLGDDALMPLAESPHLSPLCRLDLRYNRVSERVHAALAARLGRRLDTYPVAGN